MMGRCVMMRKILMQVVLFVSMLISSTCFAGLGNYPNIAVLNFGNKANISNGLTLDDTSIVTDYVIEGLLDSDMFSIMERDQLQAILSEHHLNLTGMVDPATAVAIGKLTGVEYLVYGNVVGLSTKITGISYTNSVAGGIANKQYSVTANVTIRIIDVATGRLMAAAHGSGSSTSTGSEFSLDRRKVNILNSTTTTEDSNNIINSTENIEEEKGALHTIKIGTEEVSQIQVHNALHKAALDTIYNKNFGLLAKINGTAKIKKYR